MEKAKFERISLTVSEEDKPELLQYYLKKRARILAALTEVDRNIAELKGEVPSTPDQYELPLGYRKEWGWAQKFIHILRDPRKTVSVSDLIETVCKYEGEEPTDVVKNRINAAIQYQLRNEGGVLRREIVENRLHVRLKDDLQSEERPTMRIRLSDFLKKE